jgi:tetratricopeptide (TPR) repeat protein
MHQACGEFFIEHREFPMKRTKKRTNLILIWLVGVIFVACALAQFNVEALVTPTATEDLANQYFYEGLARAKAGDLEQAIQDFTKVIELEPAAADAYYNRGLACAEMGDIRQAILDYTKAIQLDLNAADAFSNRGRAYAQLGDLEQAIRDFSQAIVLDPGQAGNYHNRGHAYAFYGELELAIIDLERYLDLAPNAFDGEAVGNFIEQLKQVLAGTDTLVPGDTLASARLQSDVLDLIDQFEKMVAPACPNHQVIQTEVVSLLEEFRFEDELFVQGRWQERWTLDRCSTTVFYQVTYIADGEGGVYFIVSPEESHPETTEV